MHRLDKVLSIEWNSRSDFRAQHDERSNAHVVCPANCTVLRSTELHCYSLGHCTAICCISLHFTAFHCIALHFTAFHFIALMNRSPGVSSSWFASQAWGRRRWERGKWGEWVRKVGCEQRERGELWGVADGWRVILSLSGQSHHILTMKSKSPPPLGGGKSFLNFVVRGRWRHIWWSHSSLKI